MGSTSQLYSLSWGEFSSSLASAVQLLRGDGDLVDVTLAAGGRTFPAHKIVLCAASPYLLDLLKSTPCQHPIVMLAGIGANDLESLLEFVYRGEVSVEPSQLPSLLQAAHCLNINGLTPPNIVSENGEEIPVSAVPISDDLSNEMSNPLFQRRRRKKKRKADTSPAKVIKLTTVTNADNKNTDVEQSEDKKRVRFAVKDEDQIDESGSMDSGNSQAHIPAQVPVCLENSQTSLQQQHHQHDSMSDSDSHLQTLMPMQQYSPLHVPQFPVTFPQGFTVPPSTPPTALLMSGKTKGASDCPGVCPLCGATLRQARNLRRHLLSSCKFRFASITNQQLSGDSTTMMEIKPEIEIPGYSFQRSSFDIDNTNADACEQIICKPSLSVSSSPPPPLPQQPQSSQSLPPTSSVVSSHSNIPSPTIAR